MATLHFGVLAQNYRCLRKVSYFSSKIRIGPVADFEDQLYGDFAFWRFGPKVRIVSYFSSKMMTLYFDLFGPKLPLLAKSFIF